MMGGDKERKPETGSTNGSSKPTPGGSQEDRDRERDDIYRTLYDSSYDPPSQG